MKLVNYPETMYTDVPKDLERVYNALLKLSKKPTGLCANALFNNKVFVRDNCLYSSNGYAIALVKSNEMLNENQLTYTHDVKLCIKGTHTDFLCEPMNTDLCATLENTLAILSKKENVSKPYTIYDPALLASAIQVFKAAKVFPSFIELESAMKLIGSNSDFIITSIIAAKTRS